MRKFFSRNRIAAALQTSHADGFIVEPMEPRLLLSADALGVDAGTLDRDATDDSSWDAETTLADWSQLAAAAGAPVDASASPDLPGLPNLVGTADPEDDCDCLDDPSPAPLAGAGDGAETSREIVFLDAGVDDGATLLAELAAGRDDPFYRVVLLDAARDGVEQISEALAGLEDIDAIHIISHGAAGQIQLGSGTLSTGSLDDYAGQLNDWGSTLVNTGDILIYGCDLAADDQGRALVNAIGILTGADVAASVDQTGHAAQGGDWDLEHQVGMVETAAFLPGEFPIWQGTLAAFTVDTADDTVDANPGGGVAEDASGNTSLRAAIMEANALGGADTIMLSADTYTLSLTGTDEDAAGTGDLDIFSDVTIVGMGADETIIDGAGIFSDGVISLTDVEISGNTNSDRGGGLFNDRDATLTRVSISGNSADEGGGIYNSNQGVALFLTNVTISGNTATLNGGGVYAAEMVNMTNVTLAFNLGGGGVYVTGGRGDVDLQNSILANNTGGNSNLALTSLGYNIEDGNTAFSPIAGDQQLTDPQLGSLGNNGGATQTHALLAGSPAIDPIGLSGAPLTDQRGFLRDDGSPDIGAYEVGGSALELIWADQASGKIQFSELGGSNVTDLLTGLTSPVSVAVDVDAGKVYWSDDVLNNIQRANLDGTGVETIVASAPGVSAIDLNIAGGRSTG
jgi:predicted outer membrane repeat protein